MDQDPTMRLTRDDGVEHEITRENSALYTFAGDLASRDHIYIYENGNPLHGTFIFKPNEAFETIAQFMRDNGFECHVNLRRIAESDEKVFQDFLDHSVRQLRVPESLPPDFA